MGRVLGVVVLSTCFFISPYLVLHTELRSNRLDPMLTDQKIKTQKQSDRQDDYYSPLAMCNEENTNVTVSYLWSEYNVLAHTCLNYTPVNISVTCGDLRKYLTYTFLALITIIIQVIITMVIITTIAQLGIMMSLNL